MRSYSVILPTPAGAHDVGYGQSHLRSHATPRRRPEALDDVVESLAGLVASSITPTRAPPATEVHLTSPKRASPTD
jgi:hypothetical protein